jgi:hypothetical protein
MNNLLEMTHAELMASSEGIRNAYTNAAIEDKHSKSINLILQGFKHIQFRHGCIKKIKKSDGYYYATRAGSGYGANLLTTNILREAITNIHNAGWGDLVSYK